MLLTDVSDYISNSKKSAIVVSFELAERFPGFIREVAIRFGNTVSISFELHGQTIEKSHWQLADAIEKNEIHLPPGDFKLLSTDWYYYKEFIEIHKVRFDSA